MPWFGVQNLLDRLHPMGPSCGNGSRSKHGQVHPYQGCLGSRCKTSYKVCMRVGFCLITDLTAKNGQVHPYQGCLGLVTKTSQKSLLPLGIHWDPCGRGRAWKPVNSSGRLYDFFDPSSGMLGFEVKNLLESVPQNRDSLDDGSHSKNAQVHPYQGCLGSRCKTS